MATLQGNKIKDTYAGLLKFSDNAGVDPNIAKEITDGNGSGLPISMKSNLTVFTDEVDITNATITGTQEALGNEQNGDNIILYMNDINGSPHTVTFLAGTNMSLVNNDQFSFTLNAEGGAAGLVNGAGVNQYASLKSADSLLNTPAVATSGGNIAIGDNARSEGDDAFGRGNIAIGVSSRATVERSLAIGFGATATSDRTVAVGNSATANSGRAAAYGVSANALNFQAVALGGYTYASSESSIAIGGYGTNSTGTRSIAIGRETLSSGQDSFAFGYLSNASNTNAIAIGKTAVASGVNTIILGNNITASGNNTVSIGRDGGAGQFSSSITIGDTTRSFHYNGVAIGYLATAGDGDFGGSNSVAIGPNAKAKALGAVALGSGVIAEKANTTSVTELETLLAGGGITMHSPNGTEYKLTVSDTGDIVIT